MANHTVTLTAAQEKGLTLRASKSNQPVDVNLQSLVDEVLKNWTTDAAAVDDKKLLDAVKGDPTLLASAQAKMIP